MSKQSISATPLKRLFEKVFLNNLINECLLQVKNGIGIIVAVDLTNSVLLKVSEPLEGMAEGEYGITNISLLLKFLKTCDGEEIFYKISDDGKWFTLSRKGHGKISVLLAEDKELIGTSIDDPNIETEIKNYTCSMQVSPNFVEDALYYITLLGDQGVSFKVTNKEKSKCKLFSDATSNQFFELPVKGIITSSESLELKVYSSQLQAVFQILKLKKESKIFIRKDFPIIFQQDEHNYWSLTPIIL